MAAPQVTYTFANSTIADATQVNQNFSDLINGISDGTKDLTFDNLDIVSFTDDIIPTLAYSGSLGSLTKGMKYLYFGSSDSAARSVRLSAPVIAADWNLTLPATSGALGQFLKNSGSGSTTWQHPFKQSTVTTTYTALADDTHIIADATAGGFTITIPAASSANSGQTIWIKKSDATNNLVTLATGISTTITLVNEVIQIQSNGSAWSLILRTPIAPVYALAYRSTNLNLTSGSTTTIIADSELMDTDGAYNPATGVFTVPLGKGGLYEIGGNVTFGSSTAFNGTTENLAIAVSGSTSGQIAQVIPPSGAVNIKFTAIGLFELDAGDTAYLEAVQDSGSGHNIIGSTSCRFWFKRIG